MLINVKTAISTSKVLLVPYSKHHVAKYHEWMQDADIQSATASEPLTLAEEYSMQQSWQTDIDKLTFIICEPLPIASHIDDATQRNVYNTPTNLLGDANLFLSVAGDTENAAVIGELELMIAEKPQQRKGYGRAALLVFLAYILLHEEVIISTFLHGHIPSTKPEASSGKFEYLRAKIGQDNHRSLALFESLGFEKVEEEPSFFGEWELRRKGLRGEDVRAMMERWEVEGWREMEY